MINQTIFFKGYGISQTNTEIVLTADDEQIYQGPVWSVLSHIEPSAQQIADNNLYAWDCQADSRTWDRQISIQVTKGDLYLIRHEAVTRGFGPETALPTLLWNEFRDGQQFFEPKTDVRIDGIPQQTSAITPEQSQGEWAWKVPAGSTITYTLRSNATDLKLPTWDITRSYVQGERVSLPGQPNTMFDASGLDVVDIPVSSIVNRGVVDQAEVEKFVDLITAGTSSPLLSTFMVRAADDGYVLLNGGDQFAARVQLGTTTVQAKIVPSEMLSAGSVRRALKAIPVGIDINNAEYWG